MLHISDTCPTSVVVPGKITGRAFRPHVLKGDGFREVKSLHSWGRPHTAEEIYLVPKSTHQADTK